MIKLSLFWKSFFSFLKGGVVFKSGVVFKPIRYLCEGWESSRLNYAYSHIEQEMSSSTNTQGYTPSLFPSFARSVYTRWFHIHRWYFQCHHHKSSLSSLNCPRTWLSRNNFNSILKGDLEARHLKSDFFSMPIIREHMSLRSQSLLL